MKTGAPKTSDRDGIGGVLSADMTKQQFNEATSNDQSERSLSLRFGRNLNPALKSWIDNVIVPALTNEWIRERLLKVPPD